MNKNIQAFSYHTHTTFSDGHNTVDEMLEQAVKLGWSEIGVSDHMIIHENIRSSCSWPHLAKFFGRVYFDDFASVYEAASRNIERIRKAALNYPIKVFIGYEVDYFTYPGWHDKFEKLRKKLEIDYLLTGNHLIQTDMGQTIITAAKFKEVVTDCRERHRLLLEHYQTIIKAIDSGFFDFVAHVDLLRGFDGEDADAFMPARLEVTKKLAETGTAFELSTKGLRKSDDYYPARPLLSELCRLNAPLVISDDAHKIDELGYCFDKAEALLAELNYTNRWKLNL